MNALTVSAVGPWQEDLVAYVVHQYVVNESAFSLPEILQMKYRITRSIEVIYLGVSKRIRLQPLYKSTVCGTVLYTPASTKYLQCIKERTTEV